MRTAPVAIAVVLAALCVGCAAPRTGSRGPEISGWEAVRPVRGEDGKLSFVAAPEWLYEETGDPGDAGSPSQWLRADLKGPFHKGAWCQHCGVVAKLDRPVPRGWPFRVRFRARSVSGARLLKVLRRWGGLRQKWAGGNNWESIPLTGDWRTYEVVRFSDRYPTEEITFSVVASERPPLQPAAAGSFCLADVAVEVLPPAGAGL
jgi:hypothetical protein